MAESPYWAITASTWQAVTGRGFVRMAEAFAPKVGPERYLEVRYENLVSDTEKQMRQVLEFIGEPWDDAVLRHTDAPVELSVDAGDDVVRIEVRDDDSTDPGTGKVVSFELREV